MVATYLAAKTVALNVTLERLKKSQQALAREHQGFSTWLADILGQLSNRKRLLDTAVSIGQESTALLILREIERTRGYIETIWLPALEFEREEHRRVSRFIHKLAQQIGISYFEDVLSVLGQSWAVRSPAQLPLFYVPMYQDQTLFECAVLYHEFSHTLSRTSKAVETLHQAIAQYFDGILSSSIKGKPAQVEAQRRQVAECAMYWNEERVEEIFCDLFATHVSGPAFVCSWLDMTSRLERKLFRVNKNDVHPPDGFRTDACLRYLHNRWDQHPLMQWARTFWATQRGPGGGAPDDTVPYHVVCSDEVMDLIIKKTRQILLDLNVTAFDDDLPEVSSLTSFDDCTSLVKLINVAVAVHLLRPTDYPTWEGTVLPQVMQ